MFAFFSLHWLPWLFLSLHAIPGVRGEIYVTEPLRNHVCHGGQPCDVAWLDDGTTPLLNSIGPCTVGLYSGQEHLVQYIDPVDVSRSRGFTFEPNPKAGPNSDSYYIAFTSVSLRVNGTPYVAYSPTFTIDNMHGSFESPLPSATSTIAIPASIASAPPNTIAGTTTVGRLAPATPSTSSTSSSSIPSTSGFARIPSSSAIPTTTTSLPASTTANQSSAAQRATHPFLVYLACAVGLSLFSNIYHYY